MLKIPSGPGFFRIFLAVLVYFAHAYRLQLGVAAVYIFFSLSGFWISRLWTVKYSHSNRAYLIFVISRCWRLWPVFILSSAFTWGLFLAARHGWTPFGFFFTPLDSGYIHQIISNTVIFGYSDLPFPAQINRPMWSLDIEAQFYLFAPFALYLFAKGWRASLSLVLGSVAFLLFTHAYILPRYVIFFLLGIGAERSKWAPSGRVAGAALAASVTLVMLLALVPATHAIILPPSGEDGTGVCDKYNHLLSAGLALLILPWTVYTTRQRGWKHDGILADLSFIFYAFHYPFLRFFNFENPKTAWVGFLFTLTTCASVWWFDNRLQGMRSAWVSKQVKAHPRAALTKGETPTEVAAADSAERKAVAF